MLATHAQRGPRRPYLDRLLTCALGAPAAASLCTDFVIFDGGAAKQFLADRGHLLRADERELLRGWLTMPLDVYEATRSNCAAVSAFRSSADGDRGAAPAVRIAQSRFEAPTEGRGRGEDIGFAPRDTPRHRSSPNVTPATTPPSTAPATTWAGVWSRSAMRDQPTRATRG